MSEPKKIQIPKPVMVDPKKLKLNPKNVKRHDEKQLHDLGVLYEMIGFTDPIIADKKNVVWAGNGSLLEALEKKMSKVPVVYIPDEWTKDQKKIFMLMDNKITESPWELANFKPVFDAVSPQLSELFQADFSALVEASILPEETKFTEEINEPPALPKEPKTKIGETYQLGKHRIMCGDNINDIPSLMNSKTVDQLLTDPPYGIDIAAKNKFLNLLDKGKRNQTPIINDDIKDYREFYTTFLQQIPFSDYNTFHIFMASKYLHNLRLALDDANLTWGDYIIWVKNNHVLGRKDYSFKHEFILFGWKNHHKFYGGFRTTVLEFDKPMVNKLHPTMKPVPLLRDLLHDGSRPEMIVCDPFLGSGSTLIACEQTNRICYGMEIDPRYIDVIIKRWENFTGKKAELLKL